jgi:hypothetical protein
MIIAHAQTAYLHETYRGDKAVMKYTRAHYNSMIDGLHNADPIFKALTIADFPAHDGPLGTRAYNRKVEFNPAEESDAEVDEEDYAVVAHGQPLNWAEEDGGDEGGDDEDPIDAEMRRRGEPRYGTVKGKLVDLNTLEPIT